MGRPQVTVLYLGLATAMLAACSGAASLPVQAGMSADEVRAFFETDPAGRAALGLHAPTDPPFCGVAVLGGSADGRWTYAWVSCSTFSAVDGRYEEKSGTSVPVRLDASTRTATLPQSGSGYAASIREMFPPDPAERALDHDVRVDRTHEQLREAARRYYTGAGSGTVAPSPAGPSGSSSAATSGLEG
jgi:hypothetical protein